MTLAIVSCLVSLGWAFLLLLLITYVFSIMFVQAAQGHIESNGVDAAGGEGIQEMYGSLVLTIYTLIQAISGGNDWAALAEPLAEISAIYTLVFMVYVLFVTFGVLNVLTGVFLESSGEIMDRDLVAQAEIARKETFSREMHEMFDNIDTDESGKITWDEFHAALDDKKIQAFFTAQQLDTIDAHVLFELIACDREEIDVVEFILGCWKMAGPARTLHFSMVEHNAKAFQDDVEKILDGVKKELQGIQDTLAGVVSSDDISFRIAEREDYALC